MAGTRSPELNVAILYQHDHGKPGFLPQEAGIRINLDIGLNVAGPQNDYYSEGTLHLRVW